MEEYYKAVDVLRSLYVKTVKGDKNLGGTYIDSFSSFTTEPGVIGDVGVVGNVYEDGEYIGSATFNRIVYKVISIDVAVTVKANFQVE